MKDDVRQKESIYDTNKGKKEGRSKEQRGNDKVFPRKLKSREQKPHCGSFQKTWCSRGKKIEFWSRRKELQLKKGLTPRDQTKRRGDGQKKKPFRKGEKVDVGEKENPQLYRGGRDLKS